ncbi:MAG: cytochrome c3 family protein [Planctomycetota bacterium]
MRRRHWIGLALLCYATLVACVSSDGSWRTLDRHRWWSGLGPVIAHDTFPADCALCHSGSGWNSLVDGFAFDHARETGVELIGAHRDASCLRCHNDRGPVATFAARGCAGCHEDVHRAQLGGTCTECHNEVSWRPQGQLELHRRTRFPLTGVHASTSCRGCHPGSEVGVFAPTPIECVDCHRADLAAATTPDHFALGYVDRCDRCHVPFLWNRAELGGD